MAKNEAKIKFTAETSGFNDAIKKSNDEMSKLRAEMKLNDAQMKTTGTSIEGLEAKHKLLSSQQAAAAEKTEALSQKVQSAIKYFGENSTEVTKLKTQLANAQTAEEKIKQAINACNSELEEQKSAANTAENAADKLDKSLDEAGDSAKDAGEGFTVLKGTIANLAASGIQSIVSGLGDLAGSLFSVVEETKEYRSIMASLEQSSKLAGYSTKETSATFDQLNGVLGDTQSAATTTANLQAIGLEQGKLKGLTDGVIGAWAKYGDSIPIDGLAEGINHTVQLGEVQGTLADVLEWSGMSVDDFNEQLSKCSSETERADLIAKMLADQGLTKAGKAWQETNKDIVDTNNAQANYEEQTATLAERITPITTAVKEGFTGVLGEVLNLTEGTDFEGFGQTISDAFSAFTTDILPKIVSGVKDVITGTMEAVNWMKEHKLVIGLVAAAIGILSTAITAYNAVKAIKAAMDAAEVTTVWGLVAAHWAQATAAMAAIAPYVLIVAAIAAVIAIIVLCVKHWDKIVAAVKSCISKMSAAWKSFTSWLDGNVIKPVLNWFKNLWQGITGIFAKVGSWFKEKFTLAKNGAINAWKSVKSWFSGLWSGIKGVFSSVGSWFKSKFMSAKNGVLNAWSNVKAKFSSIKNGIVNTFSNIKEKIAQPFEKARDAVKNVVDRIKGFFSGLKLKLPKIKLPHFKITGKLSLSPPSVPKLKIDWYKDGGILTRPTIFGMNGTSLMAGGEAGPEAILPIDRLEGYITGAIEKTMNVVNLQALAASIEDLANRPIELNINGRNFATATAGDNDSVNGLRSSFKNRGLVI